jgi:sulfite reductase (ferredoxin)
VFDLIEVDLSSAQESLQQGRLFAATVLAARCLLVTRGEQARDAADALRLFSRFFLDEKLVASEFSPLIDEAERVAKTLQPDTAFTADKAGVARFVETVQSLYDNMDPSLRFKSLVSPAAIESEAAVEAEAAPVADREADLRGVVCPLNYVKTKMLLDQMKTGEVLSVLLDEPGTRNVPDSVQKDGHGVLTVGEQEGHWQIRIRKG